jgi:hypothetical protein
MPFEAKQLWKEPRPREYVNDGPHPDIAPPPRAAAAHAVEFAPERAGGGVCA